MEQTPRPELPWALWAGLAGALAAVAISVKGIFASASSTAAIGFIFVPFIAIATGVLAGVWGLALGTVAAHLRGLKQVLRPVLIMAWVVALAAPAMIGWETWRGYALQRAVHDVRTQGGAQLEAAFAYSPWNRNKFFLGALAQHRQAGAALLDRIALLPDPELHEPMGSLWDVLGENRKGVSVMRLVAANPNTGAATLQRLAASPDPYLLGEVFANANTPLEVMAPHFASTDYFVEWGLATNPNTPPEVLERLSRSADVYTRLRLTFNRATPLAILERLAKDGDETLARSAAHALEQRRKEPGRR